MKLVSAEIKNIRSFRENTRIDFDPSFNIFVGPNGGGKSNLLDIVNVAIHSYLTYGYQISKNRSTGLVRESIGSILPPADQTRNYLKKFRDQSGESRIMLSMRVDKEDIQNVSSVVNSRDKLQEAIARYFQNPGLAFLDKWAKASEGAGLVAGQVVSFEVKDFALTPPKPDSPEALYLSYLQHRDLIALLDNELEMNLNLAASHRYLSPIRGAGGSWKVSLAADNDSTSSSIGANLLGATSKRGTQFIDPVVRHLMEKHRRFEREARRGGWEDRWLADPEVQTLKTALDTLGYNFTVEATDSYLNYEFNLLSGGKAVEVVDLSSGEQERLNFAFALLARELEAGILMIDEPELHLHPQSQRSLLRQLIDLQKKQNNQIILVTHSALFISPESLPYVSRVFRIPNGASQIVRMKQEGITNARAILHVINAHNNEKMFFADLVVLVEGIKDRLVFDALLQLYSRATNDPRIIEVLEVHGKTFMDSYSDVLAGIGTIAYKVLDLDALLERGSEEVKALFVTDYTGIDNKVFRDKKSEDRKSLSLALEDAIRTRDLTAVESLWYYIGNRHRHLKTELSSAEDALLTESLNQLSREGTFILRIGEIEDYLPENQRSLDSVIELVKDNNLKAWLAGESNSSEIRELRGIVRSILGMSVDAEKSVLEVLTSVGTGADSEEAVPTEPAVQFREQEIQ